MKYHPHRCRAAAAARSFLLALGLAALALYSGGGAAAFAQDLFVQATTDSFTAATLRFDGTTGAPKPADGQSGAVFVPGEADRLPGLAPAATFGPDGNLYVANWPNFSIDRYDGATGAFLDTFITSGSGALNHPTSLHFGPDNNLYVGSTAVLGAVSAYNSIDRYDGKTGAPLPSGRNEGALFVPGLVIGDPNLTIIPADFALRVNGDVTDLYVLDVYPQYASGQSTRVMHYNGATAQYLDNFFLPKGATASAITLGPDNRLYFATDQSGVLRYDVRTGLETFIPAGSGGISYGNFVRNGLAFGPDGNLYLSGMGNDGQSRVNRYNGQTGDFVDTFIAPGSGQMAVAFSLNFGPVTGLGQMPAIPEPGTLAFVAIGLPAALVALRRKKAGL